MYLSFIQLYEILTSVEKKGVQVLSNRDYNSYFDYRTKRLCVTLIVLSGLAFSDENVDSDKISECLLIGRYSEIKATIIRDYTKRNTNPENNLYIIFKSLKSNENRNLTEDDIERMFKNQKNDELEKIINGKISKEEIDKINIFFEKYYSKSNLSLNAHIKNNKSSNLAAKF